MSDNFFQPTQPNNSEPPTITDAKPAPSCEQNSTNGAKPRNQSRKQFLEFAAVIIAFGLLITSIFQTRATRKAAQAAKDAVTQASRENQATITAQQGIAQDTINKTIEISRNDERAWLGIEAVNGVPELGKPFIITITMINAGRSPATHVRLTARYWPTKPNQSLTFDFGEKPRYQSSGLVVPGAIIGTSVFAGQEDIPFHEPPPLVKADIDGATNGAYTVHVIGKVSYDDIFNRSHWTTFCFQLTPNAKAWTACVKYNETDDSGENQQRR
jgi:hypothetical protein